MIYKIVCAGYNAFDNLYKKEEETIIAVDGGYEVLSDLNININYFFGDCDSLSSDYKEKLKNGKIDYKLYKSEKDQTDLELALNFVFTLYKDGDSIKIYNATGNRLDHYEGALRLIKKYANYDISIIDEINNIKVYKPQDLEKIVFEKDDYEYISFFNIYDKTIISLRGFKYNLDNYLMEYNDYLCISNQVIDIGKVEVNKNILIIKSKKEVVKK